jgi:hypothetical protein
VPPDNATKPSTQPLLAHIPLTFASASLVSHIWPPLPQLQTMLSPLKEVPLMVPLW